MYNKISKNLNKKGFSLIELIVVIAIIGVLVMLAAPKFMGYTERAKIRRIQNDVKVVEGKIMEEYISSDYQFDGDVAHTELDGLIGEKTLYATEGKVDKGSVEEGNYKEVGSNLIKEARTKLKGKFYANSDGKVYYVDNKANTSEDADNNSGNNVELDKDGCKILKCGNMKEVDLPLDRTFNFIVGQETNPMKLSELIDMINYEFADAEEDELVDEVDIYFRFYTKEGKEYLYMDIDMDINKGTEQKKLITRPENFLKIVSASEYELLELSEKIELFIEFSSSEFPDESVKLGSEELLPICIKKPNNDGILCDTYADGFDGERDENGFPVLPCGNMKQVDSNLDMLISVLGENEEVKEIKLSEFIKTMPEYAKVANYEYNGEIYLFIMYKEEISPWEYIEIATVIKGKDFYKLKKQEGLNETDYYDYYYEENDGIRSSVSGNINLLPECIKKTDINGKMIGPSRFVSFTGDTTPDK